MADNLVFHNPTDYGLFDLGSTQINKSMVFTYTQAISDDCKVVFTEYDTIIKEYTIGDGIVKSGDNLSATLSISGADFSAYVGKTLKAHCTFFTAGDTEVIFDLKILKTFV